MNSMNIPNNYNYSTEYLKHLIRTIFSKKNLLGLIINIEITLAKNL